MSARSKQLHSLLPFLVASVAACGGGSQLEASSSTPNDGGAPDAHPAPRPGFDVAVTCTDMDSRWTAATPTGVDGFEVRRSDQFPADGGRPARTIKTVLPLCTKAKDPAACATKAAVTPPGGWDPYGGRDMGPRQATPELAVTTRGDEVEALATLDALATVLAPVETVDEAMLLAQLRGYRAAGCGTEGSTNAARVVPGGFEFAVVAGGGCSVARTGVVRVGADGSFTVIADDPVDGGSPTVACGRRPDGLGPCAPTGTDETGRLLAEMAYLEAASIPAFAQLARDLCAADAPVDLVARVEAARRDEVRHARVMRKAAKARGVTPSVPHARLADARSLLAVAMENAIEGCARETFGALTATYQAVHAATPELRALFATIAVDETEHAALSWDLAEWLAGRLSPEEQQLVTAARERAFAELTASASLPASPAEHVLGVPKAREAAALLAGLRASLAA